MQAGNYEFDSISEYDEYDVYDEQDALVAKVRLEDAGDVVCRLAPDDVDDEESEGEEVYRIHLGERYLEESEVCEIADAIDDALAEGAE